MVRIKQFGHEGLRIAYREGTVDEQAIAKWLSWLEQPPPRPREPRPGDVVLDVGAHIGGFTLLAAGLAPAGRVLAVEPCRDSYELLLRNIELNGLTNVEAAHLALSDRPGRVRLHHDPAGNWGHTITADLGAGDESAPAETLAGFMREREVERCDAAKLNCEGAEFPILMSAPPEALRRIQRMLVFYHVGLVDDEYSLAGLEDRLTGAGFAIGDREGSDTHGYFEAELGRAGDEDRVQ